MAAPGPAVYQQRQLQHEKELIPVEQSFPPSGSSVFSLPGTSGIQLPPSVPSTSKAQHPTFQADSSLYTCSKCRTVFIAGGRSKAKLLPCLHVICTSCLALETNNASKSVKCPRCCFQSRVEDAVDHVLPEVSGGPKDLKCQASNCPDRGIAIVFCENCNEALCTGCMTAHKRVTATKNHRLKEYHGNNPTPPNMLCPSHPNDMLHYFCQDCQKVTCPTCQLVEHKGHVCLTIGEAAKIERERFQELVHKNNRRLLNLRSSKNVVLQRLDDVDRSEKELRVQLRACIVQLQDAVTNRGSQLLAEIQKGAQIKREQYLKNQTDVEKITAMLEQAQSVAEEVLKTKVLEFYPNHMLEIKRMLSMHLERVREVKFDMNSLQHPVHMNLNVQSAPDLRQRISSFGQVIIRGQESSVASMPSPVSVFPTPAMSSGPSNTTVSRPPRMSTLPIGTSVISQPRLQNPTCNRQQGPQLHPGRGQMSPPLQTLGIVPQQFNVQTSRPPQVLTLPTVSGQQLHQRHISPRPSMRMGSPPLSQASNTRPPVPVPGQFYPSHLPPGASQQTVLQSMLVSHSGPVPSGQPPMLQQAPQTGQLRQMERPPPPPLLRYHPPAQNVFQQRMPNPLNAEHVVRSAIGVSGHREFQQPNKQKITPRNEVPGIIEGRSRELHLETPDDVQIVEEREKQAIEMQSNSIPESSAASEVHIPMVARKSVSRPRTLADVVNSLQRSSANSSPALEQTSEERESEVNERGRPVSASPGSLRLVLSRKQDGTYSPAPAGSNAPISDLDTSNHSGAESEGGRGGNRRDTPDASLVTTTSQNSKESDDWCAVCQNGCDEADPNDLLLVCDGKECTRVFHKRCHVPQLKKMPPENEEWLCTFCTNAEPLRTELDDFLDGKRQKREFLTDYERKLCQKLLLELCCNPNGVDFHYPVSKEVRDYYEIIKRPVDLSLVGKRLDLTKRPYAKCYYRTVRAFVDDLNRMFRNCSRYNKPNSEVAIAGRDLWVVFKNLVEAYFPDLSEFVWEHHSLYVERDELTESLVVEETEMDEDFAGPSKKRSRFGSYSSSGEEDELLFKEEDLRNF